MPIRLIRDTDTIDVPIAGTTFKIRPMSHGRARALRAKHTHNGRFEQEAFASAVWEESLVGWEGLLDADGKEVPFDADTLADVVAALPDAVAGVLMVKAASVESAVDAALGNSPRSSASG